MCQITLSPCSGRPDCSTAVIEELRVRGVADTCPYASRRRGDSHVWCHAATTHECFAFPDECPEFLSRQLIAYEVLVERQVGECQLCGAPFLRARPWGKRKRFCSRRCQQVEMHRRRRRRLGMMPLIQRRRKQDHELSRSQAYARAAQRLRLAADPDPRICRTCASFGPRLMVRGGKPQPAPHGWCRRHEKAVRPWAGTCGDWARAEEDARLLTAASTP